MKLKALCIGINHTHDFRFKLHNFLILMRLLSCGWWETSRLSNNLYFILNPRHFLIKLIRDMIKISRSQFVEGDAGISMILDFSWDLWNQKNFKSPASPSERKGSTLKNLIFKDNVWNFFIPCHNNFFLSENWVQSWTEKLLKKSSKTKWH